MNLPSSYFYVIDLVVIYMLKVLYFIDAEASVFRKHIFIWTATPTMIDELYEHVIVDLPL